MVRGQNNGNRIAREGPSITVKLDGNGLRLIICDLDGGVPVLQHVLISRADPETALAVRDDRIRRCFRAVHQLDALIVSAGNRVLIGGDAYAQTWSNGNVVGHVRLVLLDDQRSWSKLTEVALLDGLGRRERVPIQKIPAALGVENPERDGLGPVGGGGPELNGVRVGDLPEVAGIGHWRAENDGLARITVASRVDRESVG